MILELVFLAQAATATPAPEPTPTPDRRIELAAAAIVDDAGASFVEKIDWTEDAASQPGAVPQLRIYMAKTPWHKATRSLKRDVVDRLAKLDWRTSSWASRHFDGGMFARVYVGETFLGRLEVRDRYDGGRDDRFKPGPAWADQ